MTLFLLVRSIASGLKDLHTFEPKIRCSRKNSGGSESTTMTIGHHVWHSKGKFHCRKLLDQNGPLCTPDTILCWHRQLVIQKWDDSEEQKQGRLRIREVVYDLAFRFAKHNTALGCDGIQGELANLGYPICNTAESHILKSRGIDSVPSLTRLATNHSLPSFLRLGKISSLMNSETSFKSRSPDVFLSARLKKTPI